MRQCTVVIAAMTTRTMAVAQRQARPRPAHNHHLLPRPQPAVAAAVRLGQLDEFAGKTIVVILPDGAERYLSTALFEGI
jgi:cysteine synthase